MKVDSPNIFDKLEVFYLSAMRKFLLIISTILFVYASLTGLWSLYQTSRSPENVVDAQPKIESADIIPADVSKSVENQRASQSNGEIASNQKSPFDLHTSRMFSIWSSKFEVHRKGSDPKLNERDFRNWYSSAFDYFQQPSYCLDDECSEFDESLFNSDLALAETTISAAADNASLKAKMSQASSGTAAGYDETFVSLNRNFWQKLTEERALIKERTAAERAEIEAGKVEGEIGLMTAGWAFVGFISLMFSFLLVAIERHQRKMAADIDHLKASVEQV